jgi:hypothetical protein
MVNEYLSLINAENLTKLLGFIFVFLLFLGITDLVKNIEKIGE